MSYRGRRQQNGAIRDHDIEMQVVRNDGVDIGGERTPGKTWLDPEGSFLRRWNTMFVMSCVVAVTVDPLFFYLPVINEDEKCLTLDRRLRITAICLRSFTDLIYLANMILQFCCPYIDEAARKRGRFVVITDACSIAKRYLFPDFIIDIFAILPLPQVLVPIMFTKPWGSKVFEKRKNLSAIVLFQYVPRVLRIYLSLRKLNATASKLVRIVWVKASFNFFLYIGASHVLGAFWYLFSVERETSCWHTACQLNQTGCILSSFKCGHSSRNYTFLNDHCPVQTPNTTLFDFGIFLEALQSGTVTSTEIPEKILHGFWWGLRNLSSLGQNLQTSNYLWENCFTIFISIFGLMLLLYFIGNVQTYIQLATQKSEEITQTMGNQEVHVRYWISKNKLPENIKRRIMCCIKHVLEEKKDFDAEKPLPHLPIDLRKDIKRYLCLPLLKKVPFFKNESEDLLKWISSDYLKPVYYNDNSFIIREGEPLDTMLFIAQGYVWTYTSNRGDRTGCLRKSDFNGGELVEWALESPSLSDLSNLPLSTRTLKCHTKVEAFSLPAGDLKKMVSQYWWKFSKFRDIADSDSEQLKLFAALSMIATWRRHHRPAVQLANGAPTTLEV